MEEAKKWMQKAEEEFMAAEINFDQKLYEVSAFLSHQSAEKALKAVYVLKFKRLWKIHDLFTLGEKVGATKDILDLCEKLNPHYIATRYPTEEDYTEEMAKEALEISKKLIIWSKAKMKN